MSQFIPMIALKNRWLRLILFFHPVILLGAKIPEQVLICGVCRNVASQLEKTIEIMESIGNLFDDYRILVYENNSTDNTPQILASWAQRNPRVWMQSEHLSKSQLSQQILNLNPDGSFFVPEQIARARNIVLKEAMSESYKIFPYLIWMDMDFKRLPDYDGFIDTFQSSQEWDAVFAYGVDPDNIFWDWYAFRDKTYPIGSELLGMDWWYMPKKLDLSKEDPWHPVYSAFGGCGIYRKSSIEGCSYSAIATRDLEDHSKQLLQDKDLSTHPQLLKYLRFNKKLEQIHKIENQEPPLPQITKPTVGIILHDDPDPLIWRMSSFVYQYPSVCEHVPFHASMIIRGHNKLFINPKLRFRYGN